jgi:diamine N-acetyltransferase
MAPAPRVSLRPVWPDDADLILDWRRNPAVAAQLFSDPPQPDEHLAWIAALPSRPARKEFIVLWNGEPAGTIGLSHIDLSRGEAEYGILIGRPEARGRGVAHEASRLLLEYAFDELALRRVILRLFADNTPARRLYERLGFEEDVSRASEHTRGGVTRATAFMLLDRAAWLKTPPSPPPTAAPGTSA